MPWNEPRHSGPRRAVRLHLEHAEALVAAAGAALPAEHRRGAPIEGGVEVVIDSLSEHHQRGGGLVPGVGLVHGAQE